MKRKPINLYLSLVAVILVFCCLVLAEKYLDAYKLRILNLCAIYSILAVSMNLINGFTGQFSLGHAGFMSVGAYVTAILTLGPEQKEMIYFIEPIVPMLAKIQLPFLPALIIAGLVSAVFGLMIGVPTLRLRGDYLAIATLGFSEIIRVVFNNTVSITNGALGLKNIPEYTNLYWSWGWTIFTIFFIKRLINSSYGRAMMGIRDNEIAAEAMGINLFSHKVMAFLVGSFFAGVGGGLLANLITTIDPKTFMPVLTYQILMIIVVGGLGSVSGSVITACIFAAMMEYLRPLDSYIFPVINTALPGLRMVFFSLILLFVILFARKGIMGGREFTWDWFLTQKKA
ncbi:branched-chain amino acid ABC transporter permease [candidate division KSB3 bacterium]|uniref:Branched-chain amino acid ABC transporter permease n=1 Tax=candidate division KSB3 bacterium TaxID=2044937 RepID=A0A2G6E0U8_9BACT|nr:MAG: branched-chain amino acid ABC transporter permease [candidate division KSB3 bacterium]